MRTAAVLTAGVLAVAGLTASAADGQVSDSRAASAYLAYVACSAKKTAPPSHSCSKNQPTTAFFKSRDAHVTYKVCVKFPGRPKRLCATDQDAPQGIKQRNPINSPIPGKHKVRWYVGGVLVGRFNFWVRAT